MHMKLIKFFLLIIFLLSISLIFYNIIVTIVKSYANDRFVSPIPGGEIFSQRTIPITPSPSQAIEDRELKNIVTKSLAGTKGVYGIVIKNMQNGKVFTQNKDLKFETASLYKLWLMAETYNQILHGKLTEEQILNDSVVSLNDKFHIASEDAELHEGDITLSVSEALEKAITISDNYAALLLASRVRLSNITKFLNDEEMNGSHVGNTPGTTPGDIALFYEKLYKGTLINKEISSKMLSLLKKQLINDRMPKYLPEDIVIAHKTGELDGYKHDAGIVYTKSGDYIFVVLSESDDPKKAAERIALLSKAVYVYFDENN